jgi:hypothetical protein
MMIPILPSVDWFLPRPGPERERLLKFQAKNKDGPTPESENRNA